MAQKISIVLPAYNEEKNIERTVVSIANFFIAKQCPYEIIVVDDGSSDATNCIVKKIAHSNLAVILLAHQKNQGKGAAVKTGMLAATGNLIAFLDSDGSTPIKELEKFIPCFDQGYDVVIGSRYLRTSAIVIKQHWFRVLLGRVGNFLIQLFLLPGIIDTQCGCKMFTREVAMRIFQQQKIKGWGFDMETLAIARNLGFQIKEMPVSWYNTTNRESRFRPLKDMRRTLGELLLIKINFLFGRYR